MPKKPAKKLPEKIPNPGSSDAFMIGCTCPVLDNSMGRGRYLGDGAYDKTFTTNPACPIHKPS